MENTGNDVGDDEPVMMEQKDLLESIAVDEFSDTGNLTEDDLDEEFEAIHLSVEEEKQESLPEEQPQLKDERKFLHYRSFIFFFSR